MASSNRFFYPLENQPIAIFNQVKKEINFALSLAVNLSSKDDTPIYQAKKTEDHLFAMRNESLAKMNFFGSPQDKENEAKTVEQFVVLDNIGICHIIDCINFYANQLKISSLPKESEIENLFPSHRLFLRRILPKQGTSAVTVLKMAGSGLALAGYTLSVNIYPRQNNNILPYIALALSIFFFTIRYILNSEKKEPVKLMADLFGNRLEHIKKLCAACHEIQNQKHVDHSHLIETDMPSFPALAIKR